MRKLLLLFLLWTAAHGTGFAQLTLRVTGIPDESPEIFDVYVAGDFQGWDAGNPAYKLTKVGSEYLITLAGSIRGAIEFKFTRGTWGSGEADQNGNVLANRKHTIPPEGADTLNVVIARWVDAIVWPKASSTASSNVSIMTHFFDMPQLGRIRRVWLYLPPDYQSTTKSYPVIYMPDGQILFDDATAFFGSSAFGEMEIDDTLDLLFQQGDPGAIVVGVESTSGEERVNEYHPWPSSVLPNIEGNGGDHFVEFVANTLKPFVDAHYRTRPGRTETGIIGASSGGFMSFYAALRRPDVFGLVGSFSPAFFANPEVYDTTAAHIDPVANPMRVFFVSGETEVLPQIANLGPVFAVGQSRMADTLRAHGFVDGVNLTSKLTVDGTHSASSWSSGFPEMYAWLFADVATARDLEGVPSMRTIRLVSNYPNPFSMSTTLSFELADNGRVELEAFNVLGQSVRRLTFDHLGPGLHRVPLDGSTLSSGVYLVELRQVVNSGARMASVAHLKVVHQ